MESSGTPAARRDTVETRFSLMIMMGLAFVAVGLTLWLHGLGGLSDGANAAIRTLRNSGPLMLLGLVLAGMVQSAVPTGLVGRWMGEDSGIRGFLVSMVAGAFSPGGPYVAFPLASALLRSGAGRGPLASFLTARNTIPANRTLVWDIPYLGVNFFIARITVSFLFPLVAALLVAPLARLFGLSDESVNS